MDREHDLADVGWKADGFACTGKQRKNRAKKFRGVAKAKSATAGKDKKK